jgi:hypothetical protein
VTIPAHDVLGSVLLAVPCGYFLFLFYANRTKAPWLLRQRELLNDGTWRQRATIAVAMYVPAAAASLMLLGGIQYSFGIRLLDVGAIVMLVVIHPILMSFTHRKPPRVGDDWLLWDLRAEADDVAR